MESRHDAGTEARLWQWGRAALHILLVGLGYGLLVVAALQIAAVPDGMATLWAPAGFALAAVLALGLRVWPGIVVGMAWPALVFDALPLTLLWYAPGAVVGALICGWLMLRPGQASHWFYHLGDTGRFIGIASVTALATALLDGVVGHIAGHGLAPLALLQWWLANVAGILLFTPLALAWAAPLPAFSTGRALEMAALAILTVPGAHMVFGGALPAGSVAFVLLVLFLWAVLRLDVRGVTTFILLAVTVAAYHTAHGHGPYAMPDAIEAYTGLMAFVLTGTITGLVFGAFTHERNTALEAARLAGQVIENTPDGVMITDTQLRICSVNPAFTSTTGYSAAEVVGKPPQVLASGRHDADFYRAMWRQIAEKGHWQGEIWNRRKTGEIYLEWLNVVAIPDAQGHIRHYAGIFSDVATQEHVRKRLHSLAFYDALTDLPNRELFGDRLQNALVQARREGTGVALMFLDVDLFKTINDTYGHAVGDGLLRAIATTLRHCVRLSDTVARLGGDEFTVVLNHVSGAGYAAKVAGKIIAAFARGFRVEGLELAVGVSIGVAMFPEDGEDSDTLLRHADAAMYAAKQSGRNNYQMYRDDMTTPAVAQRAAAVPRRG